MKNTSAPSRDIIARQRRKPQLLNLAAAYILPSVYILLCLVFLGVFAAVMTRGGQQSSPWGIVCLCALAAVTVAYCLVRPGLKKRILATELKRYDFDTSKLKKQDHWDLSDGEHSIVFDKKKLTADGESYAYDRMFKQLIIENYHKQVEIYLQFMVASDRVIELPLNPGTLKMLQSLNIKLDNQPVLDAILQDKEAAFARIYDKGYIQP